MLKRRTSQMLKVNKIRSKGQNSLQRLMRARVYSRTKKEGGRKKAIFQHTRGLLV